jgi:hypothetical protein
LGLITAGRRGLNARGLGELATIEPDHTNRPVSSERLAAQGDAIRPYPVMVEAVGAEAAVLQVILASRGYARRRHVRKLDRPLGL